MKNEKIVSIILPVYNGEKYVGQAIDSVLRQTYKNIELIIVNDCSTDKTEIILEKYKKKDDRIKIIKNITNKKLPASLNIGFKNASGDFLSWTSDDNIYKENAIEEMIYAIEKKNVSFVYADYYNIDGEGSITGTTKLTGPDMLLFGNNIGACFLYKREVYDRIGEYDINKYLIEDYDYWIRINREFKMLHINQILYYYRYHDGNLTATKKKQIRNALQNIFVEYLDFIQATDHVIYRHKRYMNYDVIRENRMLWKKNCWKIILKDKRYILFCAKRFVVKLFEKDRV